MKGDNIADRLARFASSVIQIARRLPRDEAGKFLSDQLIRAGTSPGGHYAEARSGGSTTNFTYKLNLAASELREADHCLDVIARIEEALEEDALRLRQECSELIAILVSSVVTARRNSNNKSKKALRPS